MNHLALLSLLIVLPLSVACHRTAMSESTSSASKASISTSPPKPESTPSPTPQLEPQQLIDIFVDEDKLVHHGYEVRRLEKTIYYEMPDRNGRLEFRPTEVTYAVLKRNGRVLATFDDGVYHSAGNSTDFGLFDLLGDGSQQLIVSQTVSRSGSHWVVNFLPEFRVLFDSQDYGVGREEFYVIDLDKDGIYEISLPVTAFYGMPDKMYTGEIPLPEIIFKYDSKQQKYLPENTLFLDYAMRGLSDELQSLNEEDNRYFSKRLRILLRYVFAGKEDEGWVFFDNAYRRPDKEEMKSRIQAILKDQPVYQYLKATRYSRR
jgi:hypothetical protein